jgi:hypothetical protein
MSSISDFSPMVRTATFILTSFFCACSGLYLQKSSVKYLDNKFGVIIINKPYQVISAHFPQEQTLLELFEISDQNCDSVHLYLDDNNKELQLTYMNNGEKVVKKFACQFVETGYLEIRFKNRKVEIPPVIPIIYSSYDVNRVRLSLTKDGDLIVDKFWRLGGNVFLIASGGKGRKQSFFKSKFSD